MAEPVEWRTDGTPFSPRFQDRYRSEDGGLAQAREVFLAGCGLPLVWRGRPSWCVLETGFGLGLNFLATWQAWRDDPERPSLLHYVATEAYPATADDLRRNAGADPQLQHLGDALADAWYGLEPGTHRIALDAGRVLLTLLVGDSGQSLRNLGRWADCVYLDGFSPERNPDMWDGNALRSVARCCRPGARLATWTVARSVRDALTSAGFAVRKVEGVPPKRHNLLAHLQHLPARHAQAVPLAAGACTVVGAGLAGAAVARSLALRGWQVTVIDAADRPAAGASGVPAGLFSPHVSADDAVLSRLTRAGVRALIGAAGPLLRRGIDWDLTGVQHFRDGAEPLRLEPAGWIRPARLVEALLATPGITVRQGRTVPSADEIQADLVVIATGFASGALLGHGLALQPVAGQVSLGWSTPDADPDVACPWNGHGHFLPRVPQGEDGHERVWLAGASFERDLDALEVPPDTARAHREANQRRLAELLPELVPTLGQRFAHAHDWRGVRGASPDRIPIVGPWPPQGQHRVWACTALGARGITLALLCGELLAARLHGEPLPVPPRLAESVFTERIAKRLLRNH